MSFHNGLTFNTLRGANQARLPQFRNSLGAPAHSKRDGSDWNPAQWLCAVLGELGEYAAVREKYEAGLIDFATYKVEASKELADVQTYLDILALRCLDTVDNNSGVGLATLVQSIVASLGEFANASKKRDRGDYTHGEFVAFAEPHINGVGHLVASIDLSRKTPNAQVVIPHRTGIDLGAATIEKFNTVSVRVGSTIRIDGDDWHLVPPATKNNA